MGWVRFRRAVPVRVPSFFMDRQAWTAIICCVIGLVAWQYYYTTRYPVPVPPPAATPAPGATPAAGSPAPGASPVVTIGQPPVVANRQAPEPTPAPAAETVPEQIETVSTPQIDVRFTNLGGGIAEADLHRASRHLAEKRRRRGGHTSRSTTPDTIAIGATSLRQAGQEHAASPTSALRREGDTKVVRYEHTEPAMRPQGHEGIHARLPGQPDKQIPAVRLKVSFTEHGRAALSRTTATTSTRVQRRADPPARPTHLPVLRLAERRASTARTTSRQLRRRAAVPFVGYRDAPGARCHHPGRRVQSAAWVAVKNQFYVDGADPHARFRSTDHEEPPAREVWARRFDLPLHARGKGGATRPILHGHGRGAGPARAARSSPGRDRSRRTFQIYAGPEILQPPGHPGTPGAGGHGLRQVQGREHHCSWA